MSCGSVSNLADSGKYTVSLKHLLLADEQLIETTYKVGTQRFMLSVSQYISKNVRFLDIREKVQDDFKGRPRNRVI